MRKNVKYPVIVATRMSEEQVQKFDKMLYRIRKTKSEFLRDKVIEAINPKSKQQ